MQHFLLRGGVLLGISALFSKFLGLLRDRLVIEVFGAEQVDIIFAAFRIPDFFYYLLVGATVSVVFLPRYTNLKPKDQDLYLSSFFWGVFVVFGALSFLGICFASKLATYFVSGFDPVSQSQVADLARFLFGSVFLLALSSVVSAALQAKEQFVSIAIAPILYMLGIAGGIFIYQDQMGMMIIGYSAIIGAFAHFLLNVFSYFTHKGKILWCWGRPKKSWQHWHGDFLRRMLNNVAFQINQTADIWIASFLMMGSVTVFSLGTNLGQFLLSIVGFSVANATFPKLIKARNNPEEQQKILAMAGRWIFVFCVPAVIFCAFFAKQILAIVFGIEGERLEMTTIVFLWTVITLPFACLIPLFSRVFFANDDTKTPFYVTLVSLSLATFVAAILSLKVLPPQSAILGLALGNFLANTLSAGIFGIMIWKRYFEKDVYLRKP